ncbi:MAG: sulfatase-like hydrolase/transferase [Planctomycetaceae bacterium]|nr:sulfatase-like hydrolase/transferase [Planctomycetaceae bacterium]
MNQVTTMIWTVIPRFLCLCMLTMTGWAAEHRRPNFIIVSCDNLGYGDIQPFGSTLHRTPHLNRMASEGRRLTHFCVTAGVCTPSRASLITGCYAQRVGMHTNPRDGWVLRPVSPYGLHPAEVTIAEVLQQQGYATGIVGKWHLGDQPEFLPTRQGFDWFFGVPYSDDMTERVWKADGSTWPPLPLMENETVIEAPCNRDGLTKRYTERAMQWMADHKEGPFFLYVPHAMPGSTRTPFASPSFRGKSDNGPWGDAIEELDWSIGQMLDQLKELGIAENTLVVWTSDNGAPINADRADLSRGSNRPLHGRGYSTSEGGFRVPTIVWQPGNVPAGSVCSELATTMDLLPTFATLAGANVPDRIDGHDISTLLFSEQSKSPYEFFGYYDQDQLQAIRSGPWKLFLPLQVFDRHPHFKKGQPTRPLLFHLYDDESCQRSVASEHPDVVARLTKFASRLRQDLGDRDQPGSGQRLPGQVSDPTARVLDEVPPDALGVIESVRGGRHWVDQQTAAPLTPQQSLSSLHVEEGVTVELVAAEPLVKDPVAIAFDQAGRMFVVEYGDYPIGPEDGGKSLSRVVCLEDKDGDGQMDERHVFADGLTFAHSLMPYEDGLLVCAQTEILLLRDTDGDLQADERTVLFDGFTPAHPQMQIGNPRWGLDNRVYLNYAPGKVAATVRTSERVTLPRKDMWFDPRTMTFAADSGMGQYGNTIDRWGRRYYCTNRNPIMTTLLTPEQMARNPFAPPLRGFYDVGLAGGDTRVYPLVDMKSNYLSHAGTHTSACGVTAYSGGLFDGDFVDSVFVCEPIGHLVTRSIVHADGVRLRAERAADRTEFLASTDPWFRPSSLANGPGGAMYLADMYRLWVEHPKFLPPEIAEKLDWRAGEDRGRIYRLRPSDRPLDQYEPPESPGDDLELLASPHGWRRMLAQRRLVQRQSAVASEDLRSLTGTRQAATRLHALWTLQGLQQLTSNDVVRGLRDAHPRVRESALQLAADWVADDDVLAAAIALSDQTDPGVRFRLAVLMSHVKDDRVAVPVLAGLATSIESAPLLTEGLLTATSRREIAVLRGLLRPPEFAQTAAAWKADLVQRLMFGVGKRAEDDELADAFRLAADQRLDKRNRRWVQAAVLSGLADGLPQSRGPLGRVTLAKLINLPPASLRTSVEHLNEQLRKDLQELTEAAVPLPDRLAMTRYLAWLPLSQTRAVVEDLLSIGRPEALQVAAVEAVTHQTATAAAELLLLRWEFLSPAAREAALAFLLRSTPTTRLTMAAMQDGKVSAAALSIDQRVRLLKHRDESVETGARQLFGGAVSSDRVAVARQYRPAVDRPGDAAAGAKVFARVCANCHRLGGSGYQIGPDLTDAMNRSRLALLHDILDPNSKVEPRFAACTIVTQQGKSYSGLITAETGDRLELILAGGRTVNIAFDRIEERVVSAKSLMPEGVEKDITVEQMADLLTYLKNARNVSAAR